MIGILFKTLGIVACTVVLVVTSFHFRNKNKIPNMTYVSWLPEPRRAMTIPPFGIFVRKEYRSPEHWFSAHEEYHWKQYQRLGLFKFYFLYYKGLITQGYFNNPLEQEAREKGGWQKSDRTDKY